MLFKDTSDQRCLNNKKVLVLICLSTADVEYYYIVVKQDLFCQKLYKHIKYFIYHRAINIQLLVHEVLEVIE